MRSSRPFAWPTRIELKTWAAYAELPYSGGNPRRVFEMVVGLLEDMGYRVTHSLYKDEVSGWEEIRTVDGRIRCRKVIERTVTREPILHLSERWLYVIVGIGLLLLITSAPVGNWGGVAFGLIWLAISTYLFIGWDTPSKVGQEIVVMMEGEVRKGTRERAVEETSGQDEVGKRRMVHEPYITGDITVKTCGKAGSPELAQSVRADVDEVVRRLEALLK